MDKKPTCPSCGKHRLVLKQINFTTAVYLCKDKKCTYPLGHGWTYVERWYEDVQPCNKKRQRPVKKKNDMLNELDDLLSGQRPLPEASFDADELIELEIGKVKSNEDADLSFEEFLGLEIPQVGGLPFESNKSLDLEDLLEIAGRELQATTIDFEKNTNQNVSSFPTQEGNRCAESNNRSSPPTIFNDVISEQEIYSFCSLDENIGTEINISNLNSLQTSFGENSFQGTNSFNSQDGNKTIDTESSNNGSLSTDEILELPNYSHSLQDSNVNVYGQIGTPETFHLEVNSTASKNLVEEKSKSKNHCAKQNKIHKENLDRIPDRVENTCSESTTKEVSQNKKGSGKINILQMVVNSKPVSPTKIDCTSTLSDKSSNNEEVILLNKFFPARGLK